MSKKLFFLLLFLIFILGLGLRFYKLGEIPLALNRDEASLGYTAFSILKTGHEEHGVFWPINIESFGDWKLPGYVYTLIPFVKIFGLSSFSTRLPSALAGSLIILLIAFNSYLLLKKYKYKNLLVLLVSFLVAISPWGIHLSHLAYEANLAMGFFLLGFLFFQIAVNLKNKKFFYILASLFFGLTLFTYHSYQIFTPLMGLALILIYKKNITNLFKKFKLLFLINFLIILFFVISLILNSYRANQTKFSGLSIFAKKSYQSQILKDRSLFKNQQLAKVYSNYPILLLAQIKNNILDLFSYDFLFQNGGNHGSHDIPHTGKLYPIEIILILIAILKIIFDFKNKKLKNYQKLIFAWLIIASIAPIITFEAKHSIRFSPALFALLFFSAEGLLQILLYFKNKFLFCLIFIILILNLYYFLNIYFIISPQKDIKNWNWQMSAITDFIKYNQDDYDQIIINGQTWSPYIYLLFDWQYDPNLLATNLEYYDADQEGFRHAKRLENIYFKNIDWQEYKTGQKTLYILKYKDIPLDKLEAENKQIINLLTRPEAKYSWAFLAL